MSRLQPPDPTGADLELYRQTVAGGPFADDLDNLIGQLFHHPALARCVIAMAEAFKTESVLSPAQREWIILRTARHTRCAYEWSTHEQAALRAGFSPEQLQALLAGQPVDHDSATSAVDEAVQALLAFGSIPQLVQDALMAAVGAPGLVEMTLLCGFYLQLATFLNGFEIPLPPGFKNPF